MTDDELQLKVQQLRSELNGGNYPQLGTRSDESSTTSGDFIGDNSSVDRPKRRVSKNVRAADSGTTRGTVTDRSRTRGADGAKRVIETIATGVGQTIDGYDTDNSSADATRHDDKGITPRGRLIRDEPEPPRRNEKANDITNIFQANPHRGPGRPKKQEKVATDRITTASPIAGNTIPRRVTTINPTGWFSQANVITESEANELVKPLGQAFVDYGGYIDEYIKVKLHDTQAVFFSDLSYDEGEVLAKVVLRLGKKNAQVATATRTLVSGNDYISAIIILWPRIAKLVDALRPLESSPRVRPISQREKRPGLFHRATLVPIEKGESD